jgi:hypothetical protein
MALPCLAAADLETPIPHAGLLAAFQGAAQALIGHTVAVTWSWQGDRSARVEWHGRILNITNASVRIFYWKQGGMPELKRGAPGIEVEMPRANVEYWRVQVTAPVAVSAAELEDAMRTPPPPPPGGGLLPQPKWTIANVATWRLDDMVLVEVTRQKVASEAGYLPFAATPRIRLAWDALCLWMAAMAGIDGWVSMQEQVSLGNSLCRSFRQAIAEDVFHIPGSAIQRKMSADDHPDDPLGQVIQEMRSAGRGSNRSQGRGRGSYRLDASTFCRRCERVGHDQSQCFATRKKDGTWLSGNAQGGSAEKKKQ